ncbi:MAG TPA: DUF4350 domain-containing protein [Burkholderiales bacterium]
MNNRVLVFAGVAALAALAVVWFLSNYEQVAYREHVGPSNEARLRPYLAAERFAQRMGLDAGEIRALPELDKLTPGGALILPAHRQALEPRRMNQILLWVERGGHLIVEAELVGVADPLLERLPLERSRVEKPAKLPLTIDVGGGRTFAISLPTGTALHAPAIRGLLFRAGAADAPQLVSFRRGKGFVTVATGLGFLQNRQIGEHEHAEFLWHLLNLNRATPSLQVLNRPQRLSLWGFLKEHAAEALASSIALLVLWLWRIAPRFGPVAPDALPARRRLLDHLRASGRYYWTKGLRAELVNATRDAALRRLARAQPDFADAPDAEKVARLASLIGVSPEEASRFLTVRGPLSGAAFIELARDAQRMHAALEKGKR